MSNGEVPERKEPQNHFFNRERVVLSAASLAIVGVLIGCSAANDQLPTRNTPDHSAYSTDTAPFYYQNVSATKETVTDPETVSELDALLEMPVAKWLVNDSPETVSELRDVLAKSDVDDTLPLFVAYNIPNRDLGSYAAGGAATPQGYETWIETISEEIGGRPTIMILEPDALAQIPDMNESDAARRIALLASAIETFSRNENTSLYLDIGNAAWLSAGEAASLIRRVDEATEAPIPGIALNVSNYISEEETRHYAAHVLNLYGKKLYVMIDNSRNGAPDAVEGWCNPKGQRLGAADKMYDPTQQFETAFMKTPGESDGECGMSDQPAGKFDSDLLLHQLGQ